MKVSLVRKTGFFGMGSPLKVFKNGEQVCLLNTDETKEIDGAEAGFNLDVKFSFLKSETVHIDNSAEEQRLQIKINPNILKLYMSLFTLIFILPIIFKSWELGVGILAIYIIFVAVMSRKFYVIEELE